MTKLLIFLFLLASIIVVYLVGSVKNSAKSPSPTLIAGELPPCGDKPNCVSSKADRNSEHYIDAITGSDLSLEDLQNAVEATGGVVVSVDGNLLTAIYTSSLFGFIDDVLLLKKADRVEVRSASRVGHSDFKANRKRIEYIRYTLAEGQKS